MCNEFSYGMLWNIYTSMLAGWLWCPEVFRASKLCKIFIIKFFYFCFIFLFISCPLHLFFALRRFQNLFFSFRFGRFLRLLCSNKQTVGYVVMEWQPQWESSFCSFCYFFFLVFFLDFYIPFRFVCIWWHSLWCWRYTQSTQNAFIHVFRFSFFAFARSLNNCICIHHCLQCTRKVNERELAEKQKEKKNWKFECYASHLLYTKTKTDVFKLSERGELCA